MLCECPGPGGNYVKPVEGVDDRSRLLSEVNPHAIRATSRILSIMRLRKS